MSKQRTPDKVTVYCDPESCGGRDHTDHIEHVRNYPRVVETDDGDKRVLIDASEAPSWLQAGDHVTASNGSPSEKRVYLADFEIAEVDVQNDGDEKMVVLKQ